MKLMALLLVIFGIQGASSPSFAVDTCSSDAHQYGIDFCSKAYGVDRSIGRASYAGDSCYYGVDYMGAHPQATMQQGEQACADSNLGYTFCQQGIWAYFRAAHKSSN